MAERRRSNRNSKLKSDALVERLLPDPSQPADLRVLVGFLGESPRKGHWRLYQTPTLDAHVEFAEKDVVHSHSSNDDGNRLGGTIVWVRRAANLVHTQSCSREAQADFMKGAITARAWAGDRRGCFTPPAPVQAQIFLSFAGNANSCVSDICDTFSSSFMSGGSVYCTSLYAGCHTHWTDTDC